MNHAPSLKREESLIRALIHAVLIAGALSMVAPFIWMGITSFKSPTEAIDQEILVPREKFAQAGKAFDLEWPKSKAGAVAAWTAEVFSNYTKAWTSTKVNFPRCFFNSGFVALCCTLGQLVTCSLAAFALSHLKFPGKDVFFALMMASMMIPPQVLLVPDYIILMKLGWLNTYLALIVPWLAGFFGIFLLRQFFLTLPRDLWDAARIDGCTRFTFFRKVLLPLSWAPMTTIAVFTFVGNWNTFLWPLMVTHDKSLATIQVGLSMFNSSEGTQWDLLMAASTFCILPLLIGFFFAQKQFIQGIAHTGSKE